MSEMKGEAGGKGRNSKSTTLRAKERSGNGESIQLSALYGFVRGRQLEGTYPADPTIGIWPETALRVGYGWGCVPEHDWPYVESRNWPPTEPPNLDMMAKQFRLTCYQRIRSLEECKLALRKCPILAAFEITNQWRNAKNGVIEVPKPNAEIIGSHAISVIGYDNQTRSIHIRNSWGEKWGDHGYGWLPYEYFEPHLVSAWVTYVNPKRWVGKSRPGIIGLNWTLDSILGGKVHVIEFCDFPNNERIGWCFAIPRDRWLDVEEFFVRPPYRRLGYGRRMGEQLSRLSSQLSLPLRLWIGHADANTNNRMALNQVVQYLGLNLIESEVRWASYSAKQEEPSNEHVHPRRPSYPRAPWFS
jgi:GNAT superfamily N-acetyltransferase